jgi:hypothetical protein
VGGGGGGGVAVGGGKVGTKVLVARGLGGNVAVGVSVGVAVRVGVAVKVGVSVGVAETLGVEVRVGVGVVVGVAVSGTVGVAVGVAVSFGPGEITSIGSPGRTIACQSAYKVAEAPLPSASTSPFRISRIAVCSSRLSSKTAPGAFGRTNKSDTKIRISEAS